MAKVKCDVESCLHNNEHICNLNILDISYISQNNQCNNKKETICNSFISK